MGTKKADRKVCYVKKLSPKIYSLPLSKGGLEGI